MPCEKRQMKAGTRRPWGCLPCVQLILLVCSPAVRFAAAHQCGILPGCVACSDRPPELTLAKLPGYKHSVLQGQQTSMLSRATTWMHQVASGAAPHITGPTRGLLHSTPAAVQQPPHDAPMQGGPGYKPQTRAAQLGGMPGSGYSAGSTSGWSDAGANGSGAGRSIGPGNNRMQPATNLAQFDAAQGQQQHSASKQAGSMQLPVGTQPSTQRQGKHFNILPFLPPDEHLAQGAAASAAPGSTAHHAMEPAQPSGDMHLPPPPPQQQAQVLNVLVTDPRNHTGPHPWDVLLFKTSQFNTTRPAYRLGGLGLMLMTDFNQSKPLTDWHVLEAAPAAGQQQAWNAAPQAGFSPAPTLYSQQQLQQQQKQKQQEQQQQEQQQPAQLFVPGMSLVKPGMAAVQQPAQPLGHHLHQQPAASAFASPGSAMGSAGTVAGRQYAAGSSGLAAKVSGSNYSQPGANAWQGQQSRGSSSSSSGHAAGGVDGRGVPGGQASSGPPHKQGSLVSQLIGSLRANVRMVGPRLQAAAEALTGGHSGTGSRSSSGGPGNTGSRISSSSGGGGASAPGGVVVMEQGAVGSGPIRLWCTACQQPAYQLSPYGYCVCAPGHGRIPESAAPYACVRCPAGHISTNWGTAGQQAQVQSGAAQEAHPLPLNVCSACPPGSTTNAEQTACVLRNSW